MEKEKLKEYLGIVVELEKDIFVKKQIISELKSKIGTLCKPGDFYRPIKPSKPTPKQTAKSGPLDILCIPVIIVVAIISLAFLVGFVLIPAIIFIILSERKKDKKEYRSKLEKYYQKLDQYENAMEEYQRNISSDQQRIEQESLQKEALQADLTKLQAYLVETQDTLSKIYNKNIIFPKYRNFVMVSSLYRIYLCWSMYCFRGT